jgi:hypothetical protein
MAAGKYRRSAPRMRLVRPTRSHIACCCASVRTRSALTASVSEGIGRHPAVPGVLGMDVLGHDEQRPLASRIEDKLDVRVSALECVRCGFVLPVRVQEEVRVCCAATAAASSGLGTASSPWRMSERRGVRSAVTSRVRSAERRRNRRSSPVARPCSNRPTRRLLHQRWRPGRQRDCAAT